MRAGLANRKATLLTFTLVLISSCAPSSRGAPDDASTGPDASLCGDGIIEDVETCDDGPLNGTAESLCSKQCWNADLRPYLPAWPRPIPVGYSIANSTLLNFFATAAKMGVAFTNYDDSGVHVVREMLQEYINGGSAPPVITLKVQAATLALATVWVRDVNEQLPIWVEAPATTGDPPAMFYADVAVDGQPTIHQIPYPFSDGIGRPTLINAFWGHTVMLIDQSNADPSELLVAVLVVRSPTDIVSSTLRIHAPGAVRGTTVVTQGNSGFGPDMTDERVIQFFEDTGTFVVIADHTASNDLWATSNPYMVSEVVRGSWPFHVVAAATWDEGGNSLTPAMLRPWPVATLTDSGDIFIWQFTEGLPFEPFLAPYGHVAAGSRFLGLAGYDITPGGVWTLEPSGDRVYLLDSDATDLHSTALRPQRFPAVNWSTSMLIPDQPGVDHPAVYSTDSKLYFPDGS